jgi:3-oxoadipate enol-lactonase
VTPLLLLHPLGSDGSFWSPVAPLLGRPCAAPDLLGHGRAPLPPRPASVSAYADALVLDEPVVAVGISLGGLVAQALAASRPGRVRGLVLIDTVAVYPEPFRDTWPERAALARAGGLAQLAEAMETMWFSPGFRERHPGVVEAARATFEATDIEGYARTCEALHAADLTGAVARAGVPTLVVCGERDAPAFVEAAPVLADSAEDGELAWLAGAQHASVLEQPEHVAARLRDWLELRRL